MRSFTNKSNWFVNFQKRLATGKDLCEEKLKTKEMKKNSVKFLFKSKSNGIQRYNQAIHKISNFEKLVDFIVIVYIGSTICFDNTKTTNKKKQEKISIFNFH